MRCTHPRVLHIGKPIAYPTIIPCGHCIACRINKREEWCTRICHETSFASSACFITLTYDEEHVPWYEDENGDMYREPCKKDIDDFIKRLRYRFGKGIRFFIGSEHGPTTERPHYHGFLWNLPEDALNWRVIEPIWKNGSVTVGEFSKARANYAAKYYVEREEFEGKLRDFTLMSRRPGIGRQYAEHNADFLNQSVVTSITREGKKVPIPRYYKNITYSEELKEERFREFRERQDFDDVIKRLYGYGQELDAIRREDYKRTHKKQL